MSLLRPFARHLNRQFSWRRFHCPTRSFLDEFSVDFNKPLGTGACGVVYSGLHRDTDREVAIKVMSPVLEDTSETFPATLQETQTFKQVMQAGTSHPHVVKVLGCFEGDCAEAVERGLEIDKTKVEDDTRLHYFVMERLGNESLADRIKRRKGLHEEEARDVTYAISKGLEFLHGQGIAHRDVKPANVLFPFGDQAEPKLIDFSHSGVLPEDQDVDATWFDKKLGTAGFVAPEVLSEKEPYSTKCDVYSLGCTVHAMLANGRLPRRNPRIGIVTSVPEGVSSSLGDFLDATLCPQPADRPTIAEVLQEPWLQECR